MSEFERGTVDFGTISKSSQAAMIDQGLRAYMLGIYNYMTIGLAITGFAAIGTAMLAASNPDFAALLYKSPLKWVVMLAPLAFVFFLSFKIESMSPSTALTTFLAYSGVMGISLSSIFLVFTGASIANVFFISAAAFAGLSLWGYTTQKNLSGFGSFLIMGLIGILIASLVNIFLASSMMQFVISVMGVLVFSGLTAYDTQRLKNEYIYGIAQAGGDIAAKASVMGALSLYLNFINLFMMLLQLFGQQRE